MIDPNVDINNVGNFENIEDVWAAYPNGGEEGDYLYIGGTLYRWDKWNLSWTSVGVTVETTTKRVHKFDGEVDINEELHVGSDAVFNGDVRIKGTAYISRVKQPNMGLFASLQALQNTYPKPSVGMWAMVGDSIPAPIYRCEKEGEWKETGSLGGVAPVELNDYYTKDESDRKIKGDITDALALFNEMFELVNYGTEAEPKYAIRAKYAFYSDSFISMNGMHPPVTNEGA